MYLSPSDLISLRSIWRLCFLAMLVLITVSTVDAADIYVRCKVLDPPGEKFRVTAGGFLHVDPWYFSAGTVDVPGGAWSEWISLKDVKNFHGKLNRSGGVAEWPSMKLSIARIGETTSITGCLLAVQLADKPDEGSVVIDCTEKSGSNTIAFLLPFPLREKKDEFETGSQMTERHLKWAMEASKGRAPLLKQFDIITSLWGPYDPNLALQAVKTLKYLGFNVVGGPVPALQAYGMRTYTATWHLSPDPDQSATTWQKGDGQQISNARKTSEGKWMYENMAHYVISDEIQTLDFRSKDEQFITKLNGWFRDFLREKGETDTTLGQPIAQVEYPANAMFEKTLPRDANVSSRKIHYYAGKFGQWWSVKSLRQSTDLVHQSFADLPKGMRTETLPSDHHFFNAWGAPYCGMDYRGLDFFEIGNQQAVDIVSAEDWMGLNRMYGPGYTWLGAQGLEYLSAILRSGIGERKVDLRALITPSDDGYLRLKAYSSLGQGAKSFFFWTFSPTYIGTENYWSDLRSEYDGIAKLTRALEKAEKVIYPAKPVRDQVAMLYSVSHDLWHTDDPASFVENRLTWAALRHLHVQPDFLREEDIEAGRLTGYKVLYITGQCLTRKASAAIDLWVKNGGTVYLSGGAATRDEFYTPYVPSFAASVWPGNAADIMVKESGHSYNERTSLPRIKPMDLARIRLSDQFFTLPVLGCKLSLNTSLDASSVLGVYTDGSTAAARVKYGKGTIYAMGFLPGLAYSPFKLVQTTLDEIWPVAPRSIFALPLSGIGSTAVSLSEPVVEASLLNGPEGAAIVLVNYTYRPISALKVRLKSVPSFTKVVSTEGVPVTVKRLSGGGVELTLPLTWTDIVLLPTKK